MLKVSSKQLTGMWQGIVVTFTNGIYLVTGHTGLNNKVNKKIGTKQN